MQLELEGKTALVTGASKGIGAAIARTLAAEGCALHLVARNADALAALRDDIARAHKSKVEIHAADLAEPDSATRLAHAIPLPDILVNNAGAVPRGSIAEVDEAAWRTGWELKIYGYIRLCRVFYPELVKRRSGVIVNIIGMAGERPDANYVATATGNAALMMFTRSLGGDSVRHGVRVVGVNPGLIATDRFNANIRKRALAKFGSEERWPEFLKDLPIGRAGEPREIAEVTAFLASPRAAYISGTIVTVDGGLSARPTTSV